MLWKILCRSLVPMLIFMGVVYAQDEDSSPKFKITAVINPPGDHLSRDELPRLEKMKVWINGGDMRFDFTRRGRADIELPGPGEYYAEVLSPDYKFRKLRLSVYKNNAGEFLHKGHYVDDNASWEKYGSPNIPVHSFDDERLGNKIITFQPVGKYVFENQRKAGVESMLRNPLVPIVVGFAMLGFLLPKLLEVLQREHKRAKEGENQGQTQVQQGAGEARE